MRARGPALFVLALGSVVASACDDVSPLAYEAPKRDANVPDHVDLDQVAVCRRCATDVGSICRSGYDSCQSADPRCGGLLDCLTESNCWRQLNRQNLTDPPPCGIACLADAHVTSINEIGVAATQFYVCVLDEARCGPACFGQVPTSVGDR